MQLPIVLVRHPALRLASARRRVIERKAARERARAESEPGDLAAGHPLQDPALPWWSDAQMW